MAKKNSNTPAADAGETSTDAPKTRKVTPLQPEIALKIDACKRQMSSLKAINKITKAVDSLDRDGLAVLQDIIVNKLLANREPENSQLAELS